MTLMYDNPVFDVNGADDEMLLLALKAVFHQSDFGAKGWSQHKNVGMMFHWGTDNKSHPLPSGPRGLTAEECLPLVRIWLASEFAKSVTQTGKDANPNDYDVSIRQGFRVYLPTWEDGMSDHSIICAIKPVCLWLGK